MSCDKPNIAVVVLDTLRKDSFDDNFDWLNGQRYGNAWSTSHGTIPAHASLFTGYYSSEVNMTFASRMLDCDTPTLPELLSESGYHVRGYSCNTNITPAFNWDRGFDELSGPSHIPGFETDILNWKQFIESVDGDGPSRYLKAIYSCFASDCKTLPSLKAGLSLKLEDVGIDRYQDMGGSEAVEWVRSSTFDTSGEFVFLNLMEAHAPYDAPGEWATTDSVETDGVRTALEGYDRPLDDVRQAYEDEVNYLSHIYENIFDELAETMDMVVTLSDHGEAFGEKGVYQHLIGLQEEICHVPIVVSGDAATQIKGTDAPVSLIDVFQTVLDFASIDRPSGTHGVSLFEDAVTDPRLTQYHGLVSRSKERMEREEIPAKLIDSLDEPLYGVVTQNGYQFQTPESDRFSIVGTPEEDPELVLASLKEKLTEVKPTDTPQNVSKSVEKHLRDLGYA